MPYWFWCRQNLFCLTGLIPWCCWCKMDGSFEEKSSFKILWLSFSSKLGWDFYVFSIAKTVCKKIGTLVRSVKFVSPEVALYLYKSTIWLWREYCCHIWARAPSFYLDMLDKLQKPICRNVGTIPAGSLEPLGHRTIVASLSIFYS